MCISFAFQFFSSSPASLRSRPIFPLIDEHFHQVFLLGSQIQPGLTLFSYASLPPTCFLDCSPQLREKPRHPTSHLGHQPGSLFHLLLLCTPIHISYLVLVIQLPYLLSNLPVLCSLAVSASKFDFLKILIYLSALGPIYTMWDLRCSTQTL